MTNWEKISRTLEGVKCLSPYCENFYITLHWDQKCSSCHMMKPAVLDIGASHAKKICLDCLEILYANSFPKDFVVRHCKKEKKGLKAEMAKMKTKIKEVKRVQKQYEAKDEKIPKELQLSPDFSLQPDVVGSSRERYYYCNSGSFPTSHHYFIQNDTICSNCDARQVVTFGTHPRLCWNCMKEFFLVEVAGKEQNMKLVHEQRKQQLENSLRELEITRTKLEAELASIAIAVMTTQ